MAHYAWIRYFFLFLWGFLPLQSEMERAVYLLCSSACFGCTVISVCCTLHALLLRRFWRCDKGNRYWNHFLLTHLDVALFAVLVTLPWQRRHQSVLFFRFFFFFFLNESTWAVFKHGHRWWLFICLLCANNTVGVPFVTTIMWYSLQLVILECYYPLACDCKHWIGVMCVSARSVNKSKHDSPPFLIRLNHGTDRERGKRETWLCDHAFTQHDHWNTGFIYASICFFCFLGLFFRANLAENLFLHLSKTTASHRLTQCGLEMAN